MFFGMRVVPITQKLFEKKYRVPKIDLVKNGLFTSKDIDDLEKIENINSSFSVMFFEAISYLPFTIKNPEFLLRFILPKFFRFLSITIFPKNAKFCRRDIDPHSYSVVINCTLKASIAAAFKPKSLLEIGTYLGSGGASFKVALPHCKVYTMCPREKNYANNPISQGKIGSFYKKRGYESHKFGLIVQNLTIQKFHLSTWYSSTVTTHMSTSNRI